MLTGCDFVSDSLKTHTHTWGPAAATDLARRAISLWHSLSDPVVCGGWLEAAVAFLSVGPSYLGCLAGCSQARLL